MKSILHIYYVLTINAFILLLYKYINSITIGNFLEKDTSIFEDYKIIWALFQIPYISNPQS